MALQLYLQDSGLAREVQRLATLETHNDLLVESFSHVL